MVAGGNSSVGGHCTRYQWGTQQGGIQVGALSTSFEIQTQGIYCHSSVSPGFTAFNFFFFLHAVGQAVNKLFPCILTCSLL